MNKNHFIFYCFGILMYSTVLALKDNTFKNTIQFVQKYGFPVERHDVTTSDGYILGLLRLPNPNAKEPILLVHGLLGSCIDFLLLGPGKGLAFILYEKGYDVWMLNCRGSDFSLKHTSMESFGQTTSQYWNFTFHEIGVYDLPATVDYILDVTNKSHILYYGHSQGTMVLIIMLAEKPEYNQKIKAAILAAPVAFLCHTSSNMIHLLMRLVQNGVLTNARKTLGDFNILNILPSFLTDFLKIHCDRSDLMREFCIMILYEIINISPWQVDSKLFPIIWDYYPQAVSTKQALHFSQGILSCGFKKFQEDEHVIPDDYNLQNVDVPIYGLIAQNDTIDDPIDSLTLRNSLKSGFKSTTILENWGHGDFGIAKDAPRRVFNKILEILNTID